ncbi:MAG: AMP-binding protein [Pirellulaceae bacterium]
MIGPTAQGDASLTYSDEVLRLVDGIKVDWVPVFVHESPRRARSMSLWATLNAARRRPPELSVGQPRPLEQKNTAVLRRWVESLGNRRMNTVTNSTAPARMLPPIAFLHRCREAAKRQKIADSQGAALTGRDTLLRTLILRRLLRRHVLQDQDKFVGVLLPPSVPAVVANMALTLDRRIAVNLNYTASSETLNACLQLCGIRKVLTSRRVIDKLPIKLDTEVVYLEDLKDKLTLSDKIGSYFDAVLRPIGSLVRSLGLNQVKPSDPLTVIFTSGSTGVPKGVVLTMDNIASNVEAIRDVVRLDQHDTLIGILPLFHSFGYTVTMWGTMNLAVSAVYHYSPLDAKRVGKLCKDNKATVLLATPTFLRNYVKRCTPDQLSSLEIVVAGAEKLPRDLSDEFERKFGVRPVEGYGTTELSPLVSVNVPATRDPNDGRLLSREGSVGQAVPEVKVQIRDVDSGAVLGPNQPGMLWVSGPNVMQGYLHRPDLTDEVLIDGWYRTGDMALIDDDNFIHITGRVSRFSKIGGEMVPHIQVEEELTRIVDEALRARGEGDVGEGYPVAVTSVPDERKGERLIVLYTPLGVSVETMRTGLQAANLPPLYIPGADSFYEVPAIPVLGTGKLDLKGIQSLGHERAGVASQG